MNSARTVIRTENGNTMVFDSAGEQIPELQGPFEEMKDKILRHSRISAIIVGPRHLHLLEKIANIRRN